MSKPTDAAREAAVNATYDLATDVAENNADIDANALSLIESSLTSSRELATGQTTTDDLDMQFAEAMAQMFLDVRRDGPHTGLWRAVAKQVLALGMLTGEEVRSALLRGEIHDQTRWADLGDGTYPDRILGASPSDDVEPWDAPDEPSPAPSESLTAKEAAPEVDVPPTPQEATETEEDAEPTAPVLVQQETSSQRRYKLPPGQVYEPGASPWARSIGGGGRRPVTEIRTDVPGLGDE